MNATEVATPPGGRPAGGPLDDVSRLAAEAAAEGRVDFDAYFRPGPLPGRRPDERVIGVHQ